MYNNDGRLDLASANGHVNDFRPLRPLRDARPAPQSATGTDGSRRSPPPSPASTLDDSRGSAEDWPPATSTTTAARLLMVSQTQPLAYFHNRTAGGHAVTFQLVGAESNRDAVGAKVTIKSHGRRRCAWRFGGGSYLSASDPRIHFGLGSRDRIDEVEVRWPSGRVDRHRDVPADRIYVLTEGVGEAEGTLTPRSPD